MSGEMEKRPTIKTIDKFEEFLRDWFVNNVPLEKRNREETWFRVECVGEYKYKRVKVLTDIDEALKQFGTDEPFIIREGGTYAEAFNFIAEYLNASLECRGGE